MFVFDILFIYICPTEKCWWVRAKRLHLFQCFKNCIAGKTHLKSYLILIYLYINMIRRNCTTDLSSSTWTASRGSEPNAINHTHVSDPINPTLINNRHGRSSCVYRMSFTAQYSRHSSYLHTHFSRHYTFRKDNFIKKSVFSVFFCIFL